MKPSNSTSFDRAGIVRLRGPLGPDPGAATISTTLPAKPTAAPAEPWIGLSAIGRQFPGSKGSDVVTVPTVLRWITKGVSSPRGRIYLRAERTGYRWYSTASWVAAFRAALTEASLPAEARVPTRTPTQRARATAKANAELVAAGA